MASNFNTYSRLEPRPYEQNLEAGFAAAIHDPLWFLARQWQMGEHQGENASSPIWVNYTLSSHPIHSADLRLDPMVIPAEVIVESELDDWWTMGRRVRIGTRVAAQMALPEDDSLRFYKPPPPYEHFHTQFDGLALWRRRVELGIVPAAFGEEIPFDRASAWSREELLYQQTEQNAFATDQHTLTVQRHRGGRMDWHSVAASSVEQVPDARSEPVPGEAIPTVLHYPGVPHNRWWQIEDAEVDLGGYAPDSTHTSTALLTELIFSHSDDWFLFPVVVKAGHVVEMETLEVHDAFGRTYSSQDSDSAGEWLWQGLRPPEKWTLFQVDGLTPAEKGLPPEALLIWQVAELPLESIALERVQFGLDEESNLLWAVERTVDGREVESRKVDTPDEVLHPKFNNGKPSGDGRQREYAYVPARGIAPHWYPYEIDEIAVSGQVDKQRRLVQRRLVDLSRQKPIPMPKPEAQVLQADTPAQLHQIVPLAIPSNGIQVERHWQLARDIHGAPVLWVQRQRRSLLSSPARRLCFDVMEEATAQ